MFESAENHVAEAAIGDQAVIGGREATRMAAIIGRIDAFDESAEQWSSYVEGFEHFAQANDVPAEKKVAVFF